MTNYYNETCLFSGDYSCQTGTLSEPYTNFQRLKFRIGWHNNASTPNEGDVYVEYTPEYNENNHAIATMLWNVGNNSATPAFAICRMSFPTTTSFSGVVGKLYDWKNKSFNNSWEGRLKPIKEVWGVNRK